MSYCKPILITTDTSCPDTYLFYKTKRLQKKAEREVTLKTQTHQSSEPPILNKAILERAGTLIRAERFRGEIMAEFMKEKQRISHDFIDALFSRKKDEDDIAFAKRLLHFRTCYLISFESLIDFIRELDENKTSLKVHLDAYVKMKDAILGKDPDFEIQSQKGIWEFMNSKSPILAPELFLKASDIIFLDLDTSNIVELPAAIEKCVNLSYLNLSDTFIRALPPQIAKLKNLTYLNISDCQYLTKLPDEIVQLTRLQRLIFVLVTGSNNHNFKDCYTNHQCALNVCIFLFQDLTFSQQKWLRNLKFNSCNIEGLHIGKLQKH